MTVRRRTERKTLGAALKEKFRSPREALETLGLDQTLLDVPRLALDGAKDMPKTATKPNRLQYLLVTGAARALNPLLATDQKIDYSKIFAGVTTANLKSRKPTIISDAKKALKGKTIAKDASIEHLAHMLDQFEHVKEPKTLDESVSGEQHRAMEAAAHGHSNLGIPKEVGKEFEQKDKGHKFTDAIPAFLKGKGMSDDDCAHVMDMMNDELPENALDENEEVDVEVEQGEDEVEQEEAEDGEVEQEEAEDEVEQAEGEDRRHGKDSKHAKDRKKGAMDKKFVTVDQMNTAIAATAKKITANARAAMEAREFVRPYVGDLPMALDSAEAVYRSAAKALNIEDAETIHASALKTIIKTCARPAGAEVLGMDGGTRANELQIAADAAGVKPFAERFPEAARIKPAA